MEFIMKNVWKELLKNASGHTLKLNTFHHSGSIKEKKNLTYQYV